MGHQDYTIPRNNRELQQYNSVTEKELDYTIPRNNRELQPEVTDDQNPEDYTIPRNNRELQPVLPLHVADRIIPYQEIIGNYSRAAWE